VRGRLVLLSTVSLMAACGGSESSTSTGPDEPVAMVESLAPLCDDIAPANAPRELFSYPVVDPSHVTAAEVFGGMEPSSPQEVMNYELGFYFGGSDIPLTAPADLYVEAIERSYHAYDDVTDWGIAYHVCSYQDGNVRRAGVFGNFAHVTTLNSTLNALFDAEFDKYLAGQPSAVTCSDAENQNCGLNVNRMRDVLGDPEYVLVLEAGTQFGTGGPAEGKTGPAGIDTNLIDRRINDYEGNYYINPDRLGAEGGPGLAWRYGVCTYEYFPEPYRSQYLGKIEILGEKRVSAEHPCGTLEVDADSAGTVAGVWAASSMASEVMSPDFGGGALDDYLARLVVLADHTIAADTRLMISTPIPELANLTSEASAMEFDKAVMGDANWNKLVNVPFRSTEPGSIYCYAGNRYGGFEQVFYLAEVSADGDTLTLQRVLEDCSDVPVGSRAFDSGADEYFVFAR